VFRTVTIRTSDLAASEAFYGTVLPALGVSKRATFSIEAGPSPTARLHIGFSAPSPAEVDEFWRVGTEAGYASDGEPGPRPQYGPDYYGAFLLDPDGNSAEAMHNSLRIGFRGSGPGSFSIVLDGEPTTGAKIAFDGKLARQFMPDPDGNEVGVVDGFA
jgi:catechol 2,3-dioxygenase-like lactoylglutathione lyase family enzyme